jgi:hypothetical protein
VGVAGEETFRYGHIATSRQVPNRDPSDFDPQASPRLNGRRLFGHEFDERCSHVAAAQKANSNMPEGRSGLAGTG